MYLHFDLAFERDDDDSKLMKKEADFNETEEDSSTIKKDFDQKRVRPEPEPEETLKGSLSRMGTRKGAFQKYH